MPGKLAAAVRARYPGAYDDLDDASLEAAVKSRYPGVYDDFEVPEEVASPVPSHRPAAPQVWDNFGYAKAGGGPQPPRPAQSLDMDEALATVAGAGVGAATGLATGGLALPIIAGGLASGASTYATTGDAERALRRGAIDIGVGGATAGALKGVAATPGALSSLGRLMYRGALKAGYDDIPGVDAAVETGIREGINVSRGGMLTLTGRIKQLNDRVADTVAKLPGMTNPEVGLNNIRRLIGEMRVRGASDDVINSAESLLRSYEQRGFGPSVDALTAHQRKVGVQGEIGEAAWDKIANPGKVRAQKAFQAGDRGEVERLALEAGAPNVGDINARTAQLHDLREMMSAGGVAPRVNPGDITTATFLGPKAAGARLMVRGPVLSTAGRHIAKLGDALSPSHPNFGRLNVTPDIPDAWAGPPPKPPTPLDAYGIPVESPTPYQPDALDRVGVPVERNVNRWTDDEHWFQRLVEQQEGTTPFEVGVTAQHAGMEAAAITDTPVDRRAVGTMLSDQSRLSKQRMLELYRRYLRGRGPQDAVMPSPAHGVDGEVMPEPPMLPSHRRP